MQVNSIHVITNNSTLIKCFLKSDIFKILKGIRPLNSCIFGNLTLVRNKLYYMKHSKYVEIVSFHISIILSYKLFLQYIVVIFVNI